MQYYQDNELKKVKILFIAIGIAAGIVFSLLSGFFTIHKTASPENYLVITFAVLGPVFLYFLISQSRFERTTLVLLSALVFVSQIVVFYLNINDPSHMVWFAVYPIIFLFLLGYPSGMYWASALIAAFIIVAIFVNGISFLFTNGDFIFLLFIFLLYTFISSAHAWEISKRQQIISGIAERDPLTTMLNRRAFMPMLDNEIKRIKRNPNIQNLTVVMFDIDNFKTINDNFGHNVGDKILVELSDIITSWLRKEDTVARWGGEEFIAMFRETDLAEAEHVVEKLRDKIEKHRFDEVNHLTCSFGIAKYRKDEQRNELIKRADRSMIRAKQKNKNCGVVDAD